MTEYVLTYGQPRLSTGNSAAIYEKRFVRVTRSDDGSAIRWAREIVPFEFGLTHSDRQYLAAPMVLRLLAPGAEATVIWESEPGMSLRAAGLAAAFECGFLDPQGTLRLVDNTKSR